MLQGVSGPIRCAKMRNLGIIPLIIWVKELPICGCNGRRFSRFSQLSAISAQPSAKKNPKSSIPKSPNPSNPQICNLPSHIPHL
jgi:hypothetical protein